LALLYSDPGLTDKDAVLSLQGAAILSRPGGAKEGSEPKIKLSYYFTSFIKVYLGRPVPFI
jgi:hypothetical protein